MTLDLISRAEALRAARIDELEQWKALQQKAPGVIATIGDKITRLDEFLRTARQLASIGDDEFSAALADVAKVDAPTDAQPVQPSLHISDHPAGGENEVAEPQSTAARKDVQRSKQERADRKPHDEGGSAPVTKTSGAAANADQGQVVETSAEAYRGPQAQSISPAGTQAPPVDTQTSKPVEPAGSAASSETPDPVTLIDRIEQKPTLKQLVSACLENHPDWTGRQIAEDIDRPLTSVQTTLGVIRREVRKKLLPPKARPLSKMLSAKIARIRTIHEQHPTWTPRMIANEIGEKETTVALVLSEGQEQKAAPEFTGKAEMLGHYGEIAKRLGKVS